MSTIPEVAEYISVARVVQVTRICQSPYVVMFYDHILTFDQEVEPIWVLVTFPKVDPDVPTM
ncbi:hypothetical protein HYDPIDRAFT_107983 [Hydnomerulius pinastri MD-312]|nr:hypothetical protein HYDPIDRAFT_107983 [Hydnomerulius pinastri MD-312]